MQPSNIRYQIARLIYRSTLCIFLEERALLRTRALPSNCRGAFFFSNVGVRSMDEERKEERGRGPRSSSEKIGSRHRVDDSPLSRKRLHRRREPSPALFQHFAALFYLTRVRLSCDWIIQIPFSILSPLVATRVRNLVLCLSPPPLLSRFYPEIFTLWQFPIAFSTSLLLSILKPHTSKRASNSAEAHRNSNKCRSCNIRMLPFRMDAFERKPL